MSNMYNIKVFIKYRQAVARVFRKATINPTSTYVSSMGKFLMTVSQASGYLL